MFYPGNIVRKKETSSLYMIQGSYATLYPYIANSKSHFHQYAIIPIIDGKPQYGMSSSWYQEDRFEFVSEGSIKELVDGMYNAYM